MELLAENERSANMAAAKVMRISMIVLTVVFFLNVVGIFIVDMTLMIIAYIAGMIMLFIPTVLCDIMKKSGEGYVKYVCTSCAVIFTSVLASILTKHVILLYVYPIAISSLYFSSKLNIFSTTFTIIMVSIAQLVSFYIPCDKDANTTDFKGVTLFGIFPRAMILFAISMIFTMLCKRTTAMLGNLMGAEQQEQLRKESAEISKTLVTAVTEMENISAHSTESGRNMAEQSENVMRDSEENSEHIRLIGENMSTISENLRNLDNMSRQIEQLLKHSDEITAENNNSLLRAEDGMKQIYTHTDDSMKIISELSEQSKRIAEIVEMIDDISLQTDVLSINAQIEAAHAGSAGAGFAVVSQEIGTLSAKTKSSAKDIGDIISLFMQNIKAAVSAMEQNSALTREGMENMKLMKASADKINISNSEISQNVGHITEVISQVAKSGNEVTDRLSGVSENIVRNYVAVSSVSETIQKNSEDIATLGEMVKDIRKMSEQLDSLVK
ncbi:MAG: hypothetical protein K2K57_10495 [Oscillospiraceae bacterium]|nr:hypothetical protein [Oscillospiraceae bacterium]